MQNIAVTGVNQNLNVDSTSYIYHAANQDVPLGDFFLNFQYLTSDVIKQNTKQTSTTHLNKNQESIIGQSKFSFQYSDFVLIVIIFLFSMVAYIRFYGKNYLNKVTTSIFNYSYSSSFFKEKNLAFVLNNNLLLIVFYISSAMMIGVVTDYFGFTSLSEGKWSQFFINLSLLLLLIVFYKLIYRLFGALFGQYRMVSDYLFYFGHLLKMAGIFYLIMLLGAFFSTDSWKFIFIYLTIFITVFAYFIKITRLLSILFKNRFSLYYLILYFCALEIVPVMLLVKILILISRNNSSFFNILV